METDKVILDACCGGKMMWFNKNHPNALYIDIRQCDKGHIKESPEHEVKPDVIMDFRKMDLPDNHFKLVVWDPPHLLNLNTGWANKKWGTLQAETWQSDLKQGFCECWRVLDDYGTLIFKWSVTKDKSSRSINLDKVLNIFPVKPIFGHTTTKNLNTFWLTFIKIPDDKVNNNKSNSL